MKTFGRGDTQQWDSLLRGQGSPEGTAPAFPVAPEMGFIPFHLGLACIGIHRCLLLDIAENNGDENLKMYF